MSEIAQATLEVQKRYPLVTSRKKIAKYARRIVNQKFKDRFNDLKSIVKPKPRWVPMFLWQWLIRRVINFSIYNERS